MAENRVRYFVDGSTVRKTQYSAAPARPLQEPREPRRVPKQAPRRKQDIKRQVKKKIARDADIRVARIYNSILVLAGLVAMVACLMMLHLLADIKTEKLEVSSLKTTLSNQITTNTEYEANLDGAVDLDYIYSVATNELGMVYSEPGQTVYYSQNSDDYVVQYKNVPETN